MAEYILCGIIVILIAIQHIERKDLYNRIMSENLADYTTHKDKKRNKEHIMTAHERVLKDWRKPDKG